MPNDLVKRMLTILEMFMDMVKRKKIIILADDAVIVNDKDNNVPLDVTVENKEAFKKNYPQVYEYLCNLEKTTNKTVH